MKVLKFAGNKECDEKIAETVVRFELFRLFMKKIYSVTHITEDVIVGREMVRKGFSDDLACMLHAFVVSKNVIDLNSYIRFNLPCIIFYKDEFQSGFFRSIADKKRDKQYDKLAKNLFCALQKDLQNEKTLNEAVKLEMKMRADNQI
ncbi:hypothetical protein HYZ41_04460 [archaeon]|nr:hypothetical protein [archaeon]